MKYGEIIAKCNPSQNHEELNDLLLEVEKIKPKKILEIGVHVGGSLKVWKAIFNPDLLIGVDAKLKPQAKEAGATLIEGTSQSVGVVEKIVNLSEKFDFIFIDGSHYYRDVKKDFEIYKTFVREGGIMGFHDVILTGNNTCEVYKLWNEIHDKYESKTISHRDKYGLTATGEGLIYL